MRYYNGKTYKLVEADTSKITEDHIACEQCALSTLCDEVADSIDEMEFLLCDEDEDILDDFIYPIYAEIVQEGK